MNLKTWDATATMLGVMIGAGVLGIPYVVAKAGLIPGLVNLGVLGICVLVLHLMTGEIVLRTNGNHQLAGYARRYQGRMGGVYMTISLLVGIYGALVAYFIGIGEAMTALAGMNPLFWIVAAFVVLGAMLLQRLTLIEKSERYLSAAKVIAVIIVSIIALMNAQFTTENFSRPMNWTLPFGVILFSLLGTAAIPEVREELKGNLKQLKHVLVYSGVITIGVYTLFAIAVVGITGGATSEVATVRLGQFLGQGALTLLNLFAVLAMSSAFLALGEALKKMFEEDYGWKPMAAWAATMTVPAILVAIGTSSFINVIGITGAIAGGIDGILIVMMYREARRSGDRKPEYDLKLNTAVQCIVGVVFIYAIFWAITQMQ